MVFVTVRFVLGMSADVTCGVVVVTGLCWGVGGGRGFSGNVGLGVSVGVSGRSGESVSESLVTPGPPPRKEVGDLPDTLRNTQLLTVSISEDEIERHVPFSGRHSHAVASGRSMPWLPISTGSCVVQPNLHRHVDIKRNGESAMEFQR